MVADRLNNQMATEAVLMQTAISSILSKKAGKNFDRMVKKLSGD